MAWLRGFNGVRVRSAYLGRAERGQAVAVDRTICVRVAEASERALIEGLLQFYVYDFSELEPQDSERLDFNENGRFDVLIRLDDYWQGREGFHALLILAGGRPAGFALVNTTSHRGAAVERNMGEFFVARKYRRRGVAREAVRQILALYRGHWEIAVTARNAAAQAFWPQAIAAAHASDIVRHEGDGVQWRGPIWSFRAGS
jgi:predicted acetyltransferase